MTQGSDRAVIDWQSFDIGAGEAVTFRQPAASSVTLNRIHDQKPSEILGKISANGQVILSNPNGMIFGAGSRVDVAGLVATSAGIGKDAFMQGGRLAFDRGGNPAAKIINRGMLTARDKGLIALVAPSVENTGILTATLGRVQLAGAETATLDLYGDGLVSIAVSGNTRATEVTNGGRITGRRIALTAADAAHLVESAVNATGVLEASDARAEQNGGVVFGGTIEVRARDVTLGEGATLHADGRNGGGAIKIGGGWQGRGTIPNAKNTTIAEGAVITANATDKGNGGTIVAWSDGATRFKGRIEAKGGPKGGVGGNVETSGKEHLGVSGIVDASAIRGKAGEWLLDPQNVTISGSGANSVPGTGGTYNPSGATNPYTILDSSISTALSNGNNVTITTTNAGQAQTGNITLSGATITKTGGGDATLTLKAEGSIITSGTNSITSNSGKLHTVFWSDAEAVPNNDGAISIASTTIATNGGDIVLAGGLDNGANGGGAGDGRPDNNANGFAAVNISSSSILNAGGGNIYAYGHGNSRGVAVSGSSQITTTGYGNIDFIGTATSGGAQAYGVNIGTSTISAEHGHINMTGVGSGGSTGNYGVIIENSGVPVTVETTGNGNITLTGTKSGTGSDYYLSGAVASTLRSAGTGTLTIHADTLIIGSLSTTQTKGSVVIRPRTAGTTFGISGGSCGSSCNINLTDALLARLFPDADGNGVGSLIVGDSAAGTGLVDINGWDLSGKTYDVEVYGGTTDLTGGPVTWNGGNDILLHSRTGNLVIGQDFTRSAGTAGDGTLTLKAAGAILSTGTRTISAATSGATGKLHTILWSDADNSGDGYIWLTGTSTAITSNGGDVIFAGGLDDGANSGIISDGRPDNYAISNGNNHGLVLSTNTITTDGGAVKMIGAGGPTGGYGVYLNTSDTITTGAGAINMIGRVSGGGTNQAIDINGNYTTTTGNITLTGTGNTGLGVVLWTGSLNSTSGDISLFGNSSNTSDLYTNGTFAIGGAGYSGNILLQGNSYNWSSTSTMQTTGNITFKPKNASDSISILGGGGSNLNILSSILGTIVNASNITIGDSTSGLITVNPYASWASRASMGVEFVSGTGGITFATGTHDFGTRALTATTAGPLAVNGAITAGTALLRATGATSDITIGATGGITASGGGDALTLAAGRNFINNRGAAGLAASGSGRWLVYSTDTTGTVGEETLANAFNRYSCTYGGSCPTLGAGNGLLYHFTPTLNATPAAQNVVYGNAASLSGYGYSVSGYLNALDSAGDSVTGSLTGTSAYAPGSPVGTYGITHASGTLTSAIGYGLAYANNTTAIGVTPRPLTVTADSATRTFGSADPAFTYTVGNLYGADSPSLVSGVTFSTPAILTSPAGSYALTPAGGSVASGNYTLSLYVPGTLTVTPTGDGSHSGATPPPPAPTPPSPGDPGDGGPVLPPVSVIPAGLLDLIRSLDSAAHLQVDVPLRDEWTKIDDRYALDLSLSERDLSEEGAPVGTQKNADTRLSAEERRRRWLGRPLYTVSPELASELTGGQEE